MDHKKKKREEEKVKNIKIMSEPGIIVLPALEVHTEMCEIERANHGINFAHLLRR